MWTGMACWGTIRAVVSPFHWRSLLASITWNTGEIFLYAPSNHQPNKFHDPLDQPFIVSFGYWSRLMDAFLVCSVVTSDNSKAMDPLTRKDSKTKQAHKERKWVFFFFPFCFHFMSRRCFFRVWTMWLLAHITDMGLSGGSSLAIKKQMDKSESRSLDKSPTYCPSRLGNHMSKDGTSFWNLDFHH